MIRVVLRVGLAASVFCLVLGVLRWAPVYAQAPWPERAHRRERPPSSSRSSRPSRRRRVLPLLIGLAVSSCLLAIVVRTRGPAGLRARVRSLAGELPPREPGPIDVVGQDLHDAAHSRKWWLTWSGTLRVPESGTYRR